MRRLRWLSTMILTGILLGLASAWYAISPGAGQPVAYGPWENNPLVGSTAAGPYDRARVAHHALLGLTREEAVYFVARSDSAGRPLSADATYRIVGGTLPARWWSITVYGEDFFLIPNREDRYAFNSETVERAADGSFEIRIGRDPVSGNWLPLGDASGFDLFLRLYNPEGEIGAEVLPRIERVDFDE